MAGGQGTMMVPVNLYGRMFLAQMPLSANARDAALIQEESARKIGCAKRRLYYSGEQYAQENLDCARSLQLTADQRVPEEKRKHAYSTDVQGAIDYVADRLSEGWAITAEDSGVQQVVDQLIASSPQLAAEDDEGQLTATTDDPLRDALQTGDVAAYVGWDPVTQVPVVQLWESECVEFRWSSTTQLEKVIRSEVVWRVNDQGVSVQVTQRMQYEMMPNPAGHLECLESEWWDAEEQPRGVRWLGVGRIPWTLLRAQAKGLRDTRGESPMTEQVMESCDRLNAVMQQGWRIARYNAHGNLVVVGDQATLAAKNDDRLHKDVADVLTFPGGTNAFGLQLPTDPQMLNQQREALRDSILEMFGLVRVDTSTVNGFGALSGYALEILNTRTESTFKRIRRQWRKDWTTLVNLVLDVVAWRREGPFGTLALDTGGFLPLDAIAGGGDFPVVPEGSVLAQAWWDVDPRLVFPNRKLKITMGTGYIVDEVKGRDDFIAGLTSQRYTLQERGLTDDEIDKIQEQQDKEKPKNEGAGIFGGITYDAAGVPVLAGTAAGGTVQNVQPQKSAAPAGGTG